MDDRLLKGGIAGLIAFLIYLTNNFAPLFFVLVLFEVLDYITGIVSAKKNRGGVSSDVAIWGFVKKVSYFVLVGVAFAFDYVIIETSRITGLNFEWHAIFGVLSICYLLSTEAISILENLEELGVKVPFLTSALKIYNEKISSKGSELNNRRDEE